MPANPYMGEVEIQLAVNEQGAKQTFKLLPTPTALVEIEAATGRGLMELLVRWSSYKASFSEIAIIVDAGLRAAGYPSDLATAQNMVFWTGFQQCVKPTDSFLAELAGGGRDPGKRKAAKGTAAKKTKESPSENSSGSLFQSSDGPKASSGTAVSTLSSQP